MKPIPLLIFLFLSSAITLRAKAQNNDNKVTIFCKVTADRNPVDFGFLDKTLPDSLKPGTMINAEAQFGPRNENASLQWLLLHGWRISAAEHLFGNTDSHRVWLTKEIVLDNAALTLYNESLMHIKSRKE